MYQGQPVPVVATQSNVLGMVGFWLAVGGFVTCGVTGFPALICSILGTKQEPKGWAIAGIFVSIPSVLWCLFWALTWFGIMGSGFAAGVSESMHNRAKIDARLIHPVAEKHLIDHPGQCPTVDQLVASRELDATSNVADPWGTPYVIRCSADETYVISAGPDKRMDTQDDITVP